VELDSIALRTFIRKSHLTYIYGEDDEISAVNIHDQALRYHNLRQGDKEFISDFRIRFDNQVKSSQGCVLGCLRLVRNYVQWPS
jgi:hypothetical protein